MTRLLVVAAIALAGLGALALRVVYEGRTALAEGDVLEKAGKLDDAIEQYETAARWYLPGAPHVDEAYARLIHVARSDQPHALTAWRAVRSAAVATRSLWTPHAGDLADANAAIATLAADDLDAALAGGSDHAAREAWHLGRLDRDPRPSTSAAILAVVGIVTWLGGIAWLVRRGVDDAGRIIPRAGIAGAVATVAGVAAWVAGLSLT